MRARSRMACHLHKPHINRAERRVCADLDISEANVRCCVCIERLQRRPSYPLDISGNKKQRDALGIAFIAGCTRSNDQQTCFAAIDDIALVA